MAWWNPFSWFAAPSPLQQLEVPKEKEAEVVRELLAGVPLTKEDQEFIKNGSLAAGTSTEEENMSLDADTIATAVKEVIEEGIDEFNSDVKAAVEEDLKTLADQAAQAALEGDVDTLEHIAGQVLLVGEIARITSDSIAREKAKKVVDTAFMTALKLAIAAA